MNSSSLFFIHYFYFYFFFFFFFFNDTATTEIYTLSLHDALPILIATGEGAYDGRPQRVRWHGEAVRQRIPITLCAEGPKTLHLGGQICDGVIASLGILP